MKKRQLKKLLTQAQEDSVSHECKADKVPTHREVVINGSVEVDSLGELAEDYKDAHKDDNSRDKRNF